VCETTDILTRLTAIEKTLKELAAVKPEPQMKYLTIDQVAELLSVTRVTLWQWERKGILKPGRFGNLKRYKVSDIERLMQ